MCGEFGEVMAIFGLVNNFLAFGTPLLSFRDTLSFELSISLSLENWQISFQVSLSLLDWRNRFHFLFHLLRPDLMEFTACVTKYSFALNFL